MADSIVILAQAAGGPGGMMNLILIAGMFAIMYFVMIRPQQKQMKTHQELITSLKKGDEVVTQGGLIGRIQNVLEREVLLEVASGTRIRVLKTSVAGRYAMDAAGAVKVEDKKEEK